MIWLESGTNRTGGTCSFVPVFYWCRMSVSFNLRTADELRFVKRQYEHLEHSENDNSCNVSTGLNARMQKSVMLIHQCKD